MQWSQKEYKEFGNGMTVLEAFEWRGRGGETTRLILGRYIIWLFEKKNNTNNNIKWNKIRLKRSVN